MHEPQVAHSYTHEVKMTEQLLKETREIVSGEWYLTMEV